ncbi:GNAT family N-acetyltransferase [Clostridium oceanicum]|uniref:N-acetyltransferase domain-containing protein n=1 Tax=Clostridium oceanicum TaxID=1543 RepID=A0ABP3UUI6_9CLOT
MSNNEVKKDYRFVNYESKYLKSCGHLVQESWNLHKSYKNFKKIDSVYELYIRDCVDYSEYTELIVDGEDIVYGIMFGSIENRNITQYTDLSIKRIKTALWRAVRVFRGDFGTISTAMNVYKRQKEDDKLGEAYSDNFSSEVNLFIVSKRLRGKGYGYKLMNRYIEFCLNNDLENVFLWTDLGCTYSFYERFGFELYSTFHSDTLTDGNINEANGMIYSYKVKK